MSPGKKNSPPPILAKIAKFRYTCGLVVNCTNMNYSLTQRCTAKMNRSLGERFENTKAKRIHTGNFSSF